MDSAQFDDAMREGFLTIALVGMSNAGKSTGGAFAQKRIGGSSTRKWTVR